MRTRGKTRGKTLSRELIVVRSLGRRLGVQVSDYGPRVSVLHSPYFKTHFFPTQKYGKPLLGAAQTHTATTMPRQSFRGSQPDQGILRTLCCGLQPECRGAVSISTTALCRILSRTQLTVSTSPFISTAFLRTKDVQQITCFQTFMSKTCTGYRSYCPMRCVYRVFRDSKHLAHPNQITIKWYGSLGLIRLLHPSAAKNGPVELTAQDCWMISHVVRCWKTVFRSSASLHAWQRHPSSRP